MPFVQATVDAGGNLKAKVGASGQKTKMNYPHWVDLFNAAGMPAVMEPNMLLWPRCHTPLCIAFESVSVVGDRRGGGASWAESMALARGLQESLSHILRLGYRLYPSGKVLLHASPVWVLAGMLIGVSRIKSFRELLATGAGECLALVEVLVAASLQADPAASTDNIQAMRPL